MAGKRAKFRPGLLKETWPSLKRVGSQVRAPHITALYYPSISSTAVLLSGIYHSCLPLNQRTKRSSIYSLIFISLEGEISFTFALHMY